MNQGPEDRPKGRTEPPRRLTSSISGRARRRQGEKTKPRCARSAGCASSAIIARKDEPERSNERSPPSKRKNPLRGNFDGATMSRRPVGSAAGNRGRRTSSISGRARRRQGQRHDLAARAPLHALGRARGGRAYHHRGPTVNSVVGSCRLSRIRGERAAFVDVPVRCAAP